LLFMTNLGADPSQELQEVANSIIGAEAYHQLAMGQGQTQPALDMLHACAQTGGPSHTLHSHAWFLLLCYMHKHLHCKQSALCTLCLAAYCSSLHVVAGPSLA